MQKHRWYMRMGTALSLILWSSAAWADEDDVPMDPSVLKPGLKVFIVVVVLFVAAIIWYQLRKRAIVRSKKGEPANRR